MRIGIFVIATQKYKWFLTPLFESINRLFLPEHQKKIYLFSDQKYDQDTILIKPLRFPEVSLRRYIMMLEHEHCYDKEDYLYYIDSDTLVVNRVGDEILGDRVGVLHRTFLDSRGSYDENIKSTAFVRKDEGKYYFCGGFNGGTHDEFIKMAHILKNNIAKDDGNKVMALWHDESHLNRYFIDNPPTIILNPSYMYPFGEKIDFPPIIYNLQAYKHYR